jgi:hypothetical protein
MFYPASRVHDLDHINEIRDRHVKEDFFLAHLYSNLFATSSLTANYYRGFSEIPSIDISTLQSSQSYFSSFSAMEYVEPTGTLAVFDFRSYSSYADIGRAWRASQKQLLLQRIATFAERPKGWDGDDGIAPSGEAITDAIAFLEALSDEFSLPNATFAPGDGEIIYQWRNRIAFIEVGFCGDGTISWYAKTGDGSAKHNDSVFTRNNVSLDNELMAAIRLI